MLSGADSLDANPRVQTLCYSFSLTLQPLDFKKLLLVCLDFIFNAINTKLDAFFSELVETFCQDK